jgi:hypothetical protein
MAIQVRSQTGVPVALNKLVERTGKGFADGVCGGYLTYYDEFQGKSLTDLDLYTFIAQNIMDVRVRMPSMLAIVPAG